MLSNTKRKKAQLRQKFLQEKISKLNVKSVVGMEKSKMPKSLIIVDTREQKPMWDPDIFEVKRQKLDEGDYTTEDLLGIAHIERKSPSDLYGSIIQGHARFRKEIQRAIDKNIKLAVFVECPEEMFFKKRFPRGHKLQTPERTLRKIVGTIKVKYNIEFVWCENRDEMQDKMIFWFLDQREELLFKQQENKDYGAEEQIREDKPDFDPNAPTLM